LCFTCLTVVSASRAVDFKQSKLTQVVNDVQIISAADQSKKAAAVNDIFTMPDILRTGAASRAELVADDQTVTRVGANTIFSFDPASRTIDLQAGQPALPFAARQGRRHDPHRLGHGVGFGFDAGRHDDAQRRFQGARAGGRAEIQFHNGLKQKLKPGADDFYFAGRKHSSRRSWFSGWMN
jgi:hypothetical protein